MTSYSHHRTLLACAAIALAFACNPPADKPKPVDPKACESYAEKLCAEMGTTTPACSSAKETAGVMPPAACAAGLADLAFTKTKLGDVRKKCDELSAKLCKDIGPGEVCTMVETQTKTFPPSRCEEMMGKYDEVLGDLQKMAARTKPLALEKFVAMAAGGAGVPSFGPEGAKVTIVEFSDFQCPYCSRAADATAKIKEKYGDKVRLVFRQFPLNFHDKAHVAAQASLAAHEQGKFWQFHDKMFADQQKLDRESLEATAKELGLDLAKFKKALDDKTHAATVDAELKMGEEAFVDGTPTMFLNGKRVANPTDFDAISKEIEAALAGG